MRLNFPREPDGISTVLSHLRALRVSPSCICGKILPCWLLDAATMHQEAAKYNPARQRHPAMRPVILWMRPRLRCVHPRLNIFLPAPPIQTIHPHYRRRSQSNSTSPSGNTCTRVCGRIASATFPSAIDQAQLCQIPNDRRHQHMQPIHHASLHEPRNSISATLDQNAPHSQVEKPARTISAGQTPSGRRQNNRAHTARHTRHRAP